MSWPSTTSPKIVCFPVSHVVGATVMKELRAVGVGSGIGHRQLALLVELVGGASGLVFELVARSTHPGAGRIAALNHEVRDHAVKNGAIVQAVFALLATDRMRPVSFAFRELNKIRDSFGSVLLEELDDDRSFARS